MKYLITGNWNKSNNEIILYLLLIDDIKLQDEKKMVFGVLTHIAPHNEIFFMAKTHYYSIYKYSCDFEQTDIFACNSSIPIFSEQSIPSIVIILKQINLLQLHFTQ